MFPAVIDARVEAAFKLESKMSLHGFKALQEKSKSLQTLLQDIYLSILSSGVLIGQLYIDKLTRNAHI